ncbi:MAG: C1 family peptidase [Myxococcota bacterium]|nr:C1 family peptidase [Myxococcota bacterium]
MRAQRYMSRIPQLVLGILMLGCEPSPTPKQSQGGTGIKQVRPTERSYSAEPAAPKEIVRKVVIEAPGNAGSPEGGIQVETRYENDYEFPVLEEIYKANETTEQQRAEETEQIRAQQKKDKEVKRKTKQYLKSSLPVDQIPTSLAEFQVVPHLPPVPQYATGTCWSFAATSLVEAEVIRLTGKKIKLSEMYTVYYEYLDKGERFIKERSESLFVQGSEVNAIFRHLRQYGLVPIESYKGVSHEKGWHNHDPLVSELRDMLKSAERSDHWDVETMRAIFQVVLNKYLGAPPEAFTYKGTSYNPKTFVDNVLNIKPDDYVAFMSTLKTPFYKKGVFDVPDNWWRSDDYHNLPLNAYYNAIKAALKHGYSVAIALDTSEPGNDGANNVKFVPPYDIPGPFIDQLAREYRLVNKATTDDHAIHLVGVARRGDHDWFLAKDSGRSAIVGRHKGYYFVRDDYMRLKSMAFYVHKDAVQELLDKF